MKAVVLPHFGSPGVLQVTDLPIPVPGPGEVRVRVEACAVCYHDLLARSGAFRRLRLPAVLGHEVAGTVDAVGPGVTGLQVGDAVVAATSAGCGQCPHCTSGRSALCLDGPGMFGDALPGGYAEYMVGPARAFVQRPAGLPAQAAACLPCAAATALQAVGRAQLRGGEAVLVTGASGGVGVHVLQLARAAGARVIAVTTSPTKVTRLRELGADEVVISPELEFARAVRELTGGRGAAAVIDLVGSRAFGSCLRAVERGGRLVLVGDVGQDPVPFHPGLAVVKALSLTGVYAGGAEDLGAALAAVEAGRLRPVVAAALPLADAAEAHRLLERRAVMGRVVLQV